eukprot:6200278-Pyramimonas_sp.AAC.1
MGHGRGREGRAALPRSGPSSWVLPGSGGKETHADTTNRPFPRESRNIWEVGRLTRTKKYRKIIGNP